MPKYFFDTYALISLIKNNPAYIDYIDEDVVTSLFNLIEFGYIILRDYGEEKARAVYSNFNMRVVSIEDEVVFDAIKLKLKNKNLSYVDAIGYCLALKHNLKFLTGDREFENMPNVEFVH